VDEPERLPKAAFVLEMRAEKAGWLAQVNARVVGETSVTLGAGRARKSDAIDHGVGILVHHKVGERVEAGEVLFTIHARNQAEANQAAEALGQSLVWSSQPAPELPLFYGVIE